ncbi:MAG: hypothetical protein B7C24_08830 [Bacteroidetes bacterium 4572_77]|nr:MAG: hypothetical protein B7C24_08830 [Bacteroidetes bacterium 4572_77]
MKCYLYGLTIALFLLLPVSLFAGNNGTLTGKVVDEDGKGKIGANVFIVGTTRGTKVLRPDGKYDVRGIPAGSYDVKVTYIGFEPVIKNVRISADGVATLNFTLSEGSSTTDTIVVIGIGIIKTDQSATSNNITRAKMATMASTDIGSIISRGAGVSMSGSGISIRNMRPEDAQIRVDGVDVTDQFVGGISGGVNNAPIVSSIALEETQVQTGGFSAEYGNAQSGLSNSSVRSGRLDRYEGQIRYSTDLGSLYGSQKYSVDVVRETDGTGFEPVTGGEGAKLHDNDNQKIEFFFSGPLPLIPKSTFSLSGYYDYYGNPSAGFEIYDPAGTDFGNMDGGLFLRKNIQGKFTFNLTDNINLVLGGSWGMLNSQANSWSWYYVDGMGVNSDYMIDNGIDMSNIPEKVAKQGVSNSSIINGYVNLSHIIDEHTYDLRLTYSLSNSLSSRRALGTTGDPAYFTGYELMIPEDNFSLNLTGDDFIPGQDLAADQWESLLDIGGLSEDGNFASTFPKVSTLTGYYEGRGNSSGTNNPFGLQYYSATHGSASGYSFRESHKFEFRGKYSSRLRRGDFIHNIKTGGDFNLRFLHRSSNGAPYYNQGYDVYTDKWGGNFYTEDPLALSRTTEPYKPMQGALFVEDRVEYKGIILTFGIRGDYFDPNSLYRLTDKSDQFISIAAPDSMFAQADPKFQIGPRLTVKYPITPTSVVTISYGLAFQTPSLMYMYDNFATEVLGSGSSLGNPNMDAKKTNKYEVNYEQGIGNLFSAKLSIYYMDVYNELGVERVPTIPDPYWTYDVKEYGNNRGVEFTLEKSPAANDPLGFDVNYTLAWVRGTSDGTRSNASSTVDPYTGIMTFPLAEYPLARDIRHRVKGQVYTMWRNNEGPSIGAIHPLENTMISVSGDWRSGVPYTVTDNNGNPLGERNANNYPSYWRLDSRISKSFMLSDWFGEGMNNKRIQFYVIMYNITNRRAMTSFYTSTGDPIDNGVSLDKQIGEFTDYPYYKEAISGIAATYASNQYDSYGVRLYNEAADFNSDNMVSQQEKYQSYINYVETSMKGLGNFQSPFTIECGIDFTF